MIDWEHERHRFAYESEVGIISSNYSNGNIDVLDIGCGTGYGTKILANTFDRVMGLDNNAAILPEGDNFKHWDITIDDIPVSTDVIVANQFIEHLKEPEIFLSKVSNSLRPGGMCFISTPNRDFRLLPDEKPRNEQHIEEYGPSDLQNLLGGYFEDVSIYGIYPHKQIAKWEVLRQLRIMVSMYDPACLWEEDKVIQALFSRIRPHVKDFIREHMPTNANNPFDIRLVVPESFPVDLVAVVHKRDKV